MTPEIPRPYSLIDQQTRERLPALERGEEQGLDALAQIKFFTPHDFLTWYGAVFDGEDIFFGLVVGLEMEVGYFSLSELQEIERPLGVTIERDLSFEPQTLKALIELHKQSGRRPER